jgi:hypothetical protein
MTSCAKDSEQRHGTLVAATYDDKHRSGIFSSCERQIKEARLLMVTGEGELSKELIDFWAEVRRLEVMKVSKEKGKTEILWGEGDDIEILKGIVQEMMEIAEIVTIMFESHAEGEYIKIHKSSLSCTRWGSAAEEAIEDLAEKVLSLMRAIHLYYAAVAQYDQILLECFEGYQYQKEKIEHIKIALYTWGKVGRDEIRGQDFLERLSQLEGYIEQRDKIREDLKADNLPNPTEW